MNLPDMFYNIFLPFKIHDFYDRMQAELVKICDEIKGEKNKSHLTTIL